MTKGLDKKCQNEIEGRVKSNSNRTLKFIDTTLAAQFFLVKKILDAINAVAHIRKES